MGVDGDDVEIRVAQQPAQHCRWDRYGVDSAGFGSSGDAKVVGQGGGVGDDDGADQAPATGGGGSFVDEPVDDDVVEHVTPLFGFRVDQGLAEVSQALPDFGDQGGLEAFAGDVVGGEGEPEHVVAGREGGGAAAVPLTAMPIGEFFTASAVNAVKEQASQHRRRRGSSINSDLVGLQQEGGLFGRVEVGGDPAQHVDVLIADHPLFEQGSEGGEVVE